MAISATRRTRRRISSFEVSSLLEGGESTQGTEKVHGQGYDNSRRLLLRYWNAAIYGSVGAMIGALSPCLIALIPEKFGSSSANPVSREL
jgi:hypothetical protein